MCGKTRSSFLYEFLISEYDQVRSFYLTVRREKIVLCLFLRGEGKRNNGQWRNKWTRTNPSGSQTTSPNNENVRRFCKIKYMRPVRSKCKFFRTGNPTILVLYFSPQKLWKTGQPISHFHLLSDKSNRQI